MFLIRHAASPGAAERSVRLAVPARWALITPFQPGRNPDPGFRFSPRGLALSCRTVEPVSGAFGDSRRLFVDRTGPEHQHVLLLCGNVLKCTSPRRHFLCVPMAGPGFETIIPSRQSSKPSSLLESWWKWEFQAVQDMSHAGDQRARRPVAMMTLGQRPAMSFRQEKQSGLIQ